MKVCHLTSVHNYNDTRITVKECSTLVRQGYEVHLVVPNTSIKKYKGVNIQGVKNVNKGRINRITKFTKKVFEKAKEIDADIYHFHDPELIPLALKLKKLGKKVIYDIHEDVPRQILSKEWIPNLLRKIISKSFEIYENRSARKFDYLVTSTPFINERFKNKGIETTVDVNNYPILDELFIPNLKWHTKSKSVCYVGGLSKTRGIFEMIDSVYHSNALLNIAGNFQNENLKKEVESKRGWNYVNYLGYVDREEVKKILANSMAGFVVLHPLINYIDAHPIKMFEYMGAGLPVIASNFPLWKSILEENNAGICVNPTNIKEISHALEWFINNPKQAKLMGENGRRAVEDKYNWELESEKLIKVYQKLDPT
ncbi:glycosyltransferase family 4 protein [Halobacillus sp. Marseille-P3879]|uniref:glycosyltransferase family 4 protein n=1 Tax=Halobacillus sp. Marseille-P3879 TaxID=2045014 RepID=UPI000C7D07E2|nr:glycosyltransferase family 4 protein [Halobacillus sp. Marseille-P3879]